ncbi:MAG: DUF4256 domain-containing protein [Rectinemataceae bacterium]|nr:DUF4256 domain-containing protein [Rectinemataceae bacterium]
MNEGSHDDLMNTLKDRFLKNGKRHVNIDWTSVEKKLKENTDKIHIVQKMESSGGEPDVIGYEEKTREFIFCDCAPESPIGRRGLCYDREALDSRKENKPGSSAIEMATLTGIEILSEEQYREMQKNDEYDKKTSSWIKTPDKIRKLGGALFCDRRYDHVFTYHNGAESYYSARGFRGILKV